MLNMLEDSLRNFMISQGVDGMEAELAARRCANAIEVGGLAGGTIAATIAIKTGNPAAVLLAVVGATVGGGLMVTNADACKEVRAAAKKLADDELFRLPLPSAQGQ